MEPNEQYTLYDGDAGGSQRWVAHVRLTPELLQRLQQQPTEVTIQLQAPGSGTATHTATNKLTSVLKVNADSEELTYEMLSFAEDPKVNAVCAFRPDETHTQGAEDTGYSLYHVGNVFQKLIVQRMLDSTEKDRMKDRHAKSVLESKSRSSKLVAAEEAKGLGSKRSSSAKQLMMKGVKMDFPPGHSIDLLKHGPTSVSTTLTQKSGFKSALTPSAAQELHERIVKGNNIPVGETEVDANYHDQPAKSMIFSSDSESEKAAEPFRPTSDVSMQADSKIPVPKEERVKKAARKATAKIDATQEKTTIIPDADTTAHPKPKLKSYQTMFAAKPTADEVEDQSRTIVYGGTKRKAVAQPLAEVPAAEVVPKITVPSVKAPKTETKKRARPRLSRLPDISFFPQAVQDICKRVSAHIIRTAILDEADYESFATEHDRFRTEWEVLDKAYSIESILIDGAHFQLPFATSEEEKQTLKNTIQAADKKREGLLFLRDTMATIHKILASLQASISAYEQRTTKLPQSVALRKMEDIESSTFTSVMMDCTKLVAAVADMERQLQQHTPFLAARLRTVVLKQKEIAIACESQRINAQHQVNQLLADVGEWERRVDASKDRQVQVQATSEAFEKQKDELVVAVGQLRMDEQTVRDSIGNMTAEHEATCHDAIKHQQELHQKIERAKYLMSLHAASTGIKWNFSEETIGGEILAPTTNNIVAFEIDSKENSFVAANILWEKIDRAFGDSDYST